MPEHRDGTPTHLRDLESFLWWDFDDLATWASWVGQRGGSAAAAKASFEVALQTQQILRELEAAHNGGETGDAIDRLNAAIAARDIRPRAGRDGSMGFEPANRLDPVGRVLALVLRAMVEGSWRRFKLCHDSGCRASYYDATRNAAKTWCSMETCGSRNKMRRFRAKPGQAQADTLADAPPGRRKR